MIGKLHHWLEGALITVGLFVLFGIVSVLLPDWLVNGWLDRIGIVLGVVLALPVFWTAYQVSWGQQRRLKKQFREISQNPGARPTILIVDLLPGRDTRHQVENYRRQQEALRDIPAEHVLVVSRDERLHPDDIPQLQQELREASRALMQSGTDRIHLFLAAPVAAAAMVGAEFANMPVNIYQYDKGNYVSYGYLRL